MKTLTRKRPRPGSEIAKSSSNSRTKVARCSALMSAKAVWRTVSGVRTCLLTGRIWPSILILMGALEVKKRSEAFFSTISLNRGFVLSVGWPPALKLSPGDSVACGPVVVSAASAGGFAGALSFAGVLLDSIAYGALQRPAGIFFDDLQRATIIDCLGFALALELDAQAQLVLGICVAQGILVGNETRFVQLEQRLIEGLHPQARGARHDFLDLGHLAFEDQVLDERRVEHDFHRCNPAGAGL